MTWQSSLLMDILSAHDLEVALLQQKILSTIPNGLWFTWNIILVTLFCTIYHLTYLNWHIAVHLQICSYYIMYIWFTYLTYNNYFNFITWISWSLDMFFFLVFFILYIIRSAPYFFLYNITFYTAVNCLTYVNIILSWHKISVCTTMSPFFSIFYLH